MRQDLNQFALQHNEGFTLVELVMVIILLGILSAYVAPRVFDRSEIASSVYQNRIISILRNMQTRAMQDTRSNVNSTGTGYCYQVNFNSTQLGIPANNFSSNNSLADIQLSCSKTTIDTSDPAELFHIQNLEGVTLSVSAPIPVNTSTRPVLTAIRFDPLGRAVGLDPFTSAPNDEISCSATTASPSEGCTIELSGSSSAKICIESEGYIYAC